MAAGAVTGFMTVQTPGAPVSRAGWEARTTIPSRVPDPAMLRLEEAGEQRVHAKQAGAAEPDRVAVDRGVVLVGQRLPRLAELPRDLDAELVAEIRRVELPGLQLQDPRADQPLLVVHGQGAVDRNFPLPELLEIGFPLYQVLVVD